MQTCSNCGAASRTGAKFCTTCGTRLNEGAPESTGWTSTDDAPSTAARGAAEGERSVGEDAEPTESRDPATSWGWGDSSQTTSGTPEETASPSTDAEDQPSAEPASASPWTWGESTGSAGPADETSSTEAEAEAETQPASTPEPTSSWTWGETDESTPETSAGDPSAARHVDRSGSVFSWSWSQPSEPTASPDPESEQPARATARDDVTDEESVERSVEAAAGEDVPEESDAAPDPRPDSEGEPGEAADQSASGDDDALAAWSAEWADPGAPDPGDDNDATDLGVESKEGQWVNYGAAATDVAPRERAEALLDELRALIPTLAAPDAPIGFEAEPTTVSDATATSAALDDLLAARTTGLGDTTDLRRALVTTRDSPRDVHAMIDLVGRIEDIIAVLDDRDRLIAAIDEATGNA